MILTEIPMKSDNGCYTIGFCEMICEENDESILYKKELDRRNKAKKELEDSKDDIGWGAQIRSYVFDDSRVKDHRTGYQESDVQKVMNGNIDGFIKAYLLSKF